MTWRDWVAGAFVLVWYGLAGWTIYMWYQQTLPVF